MGKYQPLDIVTFGRALIDTQDLDPIYTMLYNSGLEKPFLKRWMLAYWCFYHAGVACKIASAEDWYKEAKSGLSGPDKFPRGKERRHFRGDASVKSLAYLEKHYPNPEDAVDYLCRSNTYKGVEKRISKWYLFGPWISFKAGDMLERVLGHPVHFDINDLEFYKEPAEGAKLLDPIASLKTVVTNLISVFSDRKAPPAFDRPIGVQETESCLCKWKSHMHGRYQVGDDIREIRHGMLGWGDLAEKMRNHLPPEVKI